MTRLILLVAFVLRIAAALVWQGMADADHQTFRFGDSETYWVLAQKISDGKPYDYAGADSRIFRAPLYPILLSPATRLEGRTGVLAARFLGVALGTLTVGLVMLAAWRIAGRQAGLCSGLLAAIYPGAIGMSVFVLSEALFCPLCLACLVAWTWSDQKKYSVIWACAAGVACGLACLTRPSWILWPGMLALVTILFCFLASQFRNDQDLRFPFQFMRLAMFGLAMSLTMSPWWIRNYQITGKFVPTTLQVGGSLYDGLHSGASGSSDEGMAFSIPFEMELRAEDARLGSKELDANDHSKPTNQPRDCFEWRLNQRLLNAAISWSNENRYATVRLALVKFAKMWNPWPTAKELGGIWIRIAESVMYVVIVGCAGIALWSVPQYRRIMIFYVSPAIYFAALHMVFVGSVRYRQPAVLVLCLVAGIGAAWMLDRIKDRSNQMRIRKR